MRLRRLGLNWLLAGVPLTLVSAHVLRHPVLVFAAACVAIVPLSALIGHATEQLALRSGPRVGGLLNATFGNVTELIVSILLISAGEIEVVKASLMGSVIGNLVLVLGSSLLLGGLRHKEQRLSARSAGVHSASLVLAVAGLAMPTLLMSGRGVTGAQGTIVSAGIAAVMIALYLGGLAFSLGTHRHLFASRDEGSAAPSWSSSRSLIVLAVCALLVGLESEYLVGSLRPTVAALGVSRVFIGFVVVAVVGNAAEHANAVVFAIRNQADIAMEISFSSATQIALFAAPALVFVSLLLGHPMRLVFDGMQLAAAALASVLVTLLTMDGRSNWLEGMQLLGAYAIIVLTFLFPVAGR